MRLALKLHPDSRCTAVTRIEADVARPGPGRLVLHYFVAGRMSDLRLPPAGTPAFADELWRHTCFEAFVRASAGEAYYEFNFAPSRQWAAYCFSGYRSGMAVAEEISVPGIEVRSNGGSCELRTSLALDRLPGLADDTVWHLGLSAVIEEACGLRSYWALGHPPGKADFHHADCFVHELSRTEQP